MSLLLSFVVLLASIQASNPPPVSVESVLQVEQRFTATLMQRDDVEFGKLLADDLVHISFEGQSAGKAEYMAFFKQGAWRYTKYEPSDVKVKVLGTTSVVTGRVNRTIIVNNKETSGAFAFTHVWSRIGDPMAPHLFTGNHRAATIIVTTSALPQKYESHLDRVSTGSGSDLVQPSEFKILREYCMPINDQVATAPCTDPIQQ